jgi:hypothetical protein
MRRLACGVTLPSSVLQSKVTAFRVIMDEDEGKVHDRLGSGLLVLLDNDTVAFVKKLLGGYDHEPHHWYNLSNIVRIEGYNDGFDAEVYYGATQDEPAEVTTYFYELKGETNRWLETLSQKRKTKPSPEATPPKAQPITIKEREVIREIVKVRCRHCGNLYDERDNRCPHCGGI